MPTKAVPLLPLQEVLREQQRRVRPAVQHRESQVYRRLQSDVAASDDTESADARGRRSTSAQDHEQHADGNDGMVDRPYHHGWNLSDLVDGDGHGHDGDGDKPPDGGYGWVCTGCAFFINAHTWGVNASWGIFLARFVSLDTYPNVSRFEYAMVGGLSVSQALLVSPVAVACQDHYGARGTMVFGSVVVFLGLFSAASSTHFWQLLVSQGLFFGWGMGFVYTPAMAVLPGWFDSHRSLAVGTAMSGAGLGGLAYTIVTNRLVEHLDVPWTYRVLSFVSVFFNVASAVLMREPPGRRQHPRRRRMNKKSFPSSNNARTRNLPFRAYCARVEVLLVAAWGFATELGYVGLLYTLPYYATAVGLSDAQGSAAQAVLNLGLGLGRPVVGWASDRAGRLNVALASTLLCALLCAGAWPAAGADYPALLAFALLAGAVSGTFWTSCGPVLAEVVGLDDFAAAFGFVCFMLVLPNTFAEGITMQLVRDEKYETMAGHRRGSFLAAQIFVGATYLLGAVFLLLLRAWKMWDDERRRREASDETASAEEIDQVDQGESRGHDAKPWEWLAGRRLFLTGRV